MSLGLTTALMLPIAVLPAAGILLLAPTVSGALTLLPVTASTSIGLGDGGREGGGDTRLASAWNGAPWPCHSPSSAVVRSCFPS